MRSALVPLLTLIAVSFGRVEAQDPPAVSPLQDPAPTVAAIQAEIDALTANEALAAELKASVNAVLVSALESARAAENFAAARRALPSPEKIAQDVIDTRSAIESAATPELPNGADAPPLQQAEQALARAQQEQITAQDAVTELDKIATNRAKGRAEIPGRLVELRKALEAFPANVPTENVDARLLAARKLRHRAERHRLETEIAALDAELRSYEAREQLLSLRRDLAARLSNNSKAIAEAWQSIVQDGRAAAAAAARAAVQQDVRQARDEHPLIRRLAAENQRIAALLTPQVEQQKLVESLIASAQGLQERIQVQFQDIKKRAEGAGSTQSLGRMLREGRAKLPEVNRVFRREGGPDEAAEAEAYLDSIDREQERRQLADDPGALDRQIEELVPPITDPVVRAQVFTRGQELIALRLQMLRTLSDNSSKYLGSLQSLQATRQAVRELVAEYRAFVNERVLWIRSSSPIWRLDVAAAGAALTWLVSPRQWWATASSMVEVAAAEVWPVLVLLLLLLVWSMQPFWRRRLSHWRDVAVRGNNTRYAPTAWALLSTILLAAPMPAMLCLAGWLLRNGTDGAAFGKSMSVGFMHTAAFLAVLTVLRQVVRRKGLAEAHFRWRANTLGLLRGNLWLLIPAVFPLATGLGALEKHGDDGWLGSLGRLLLLPLLLLLMVFLWRLLHPATGVLGGQKQQSFLGRFRGLWFALGVGTSLALLAMTVLGYEYTVIQLARSLIYTVAIVLGGALVHALILHKLLLERRRLSIRQSREKLEAARAAREQAAEEGSDEQTDPPEEQFELDPSSIAEQTHAVMRAGVVLAVLFACLGVWGEVLPALGGFRAFPLWTDHSTEPEIKITLADLLMSMLIMLVTFVAARNLPGLLELLVLRRLNIQAGERHATTTLARYVLVVIGTVMAFSSIGIGWSKVQWLVAAMSLGLGFGLQEIFANFVSGLILLFERPVRVGDWVLVGDWLGKVTRIKIRATTVRDLDNKELLVPNKEFVTGRFVNWTLTDSLVRLRLLVGVAYGSDTEKAKKLLEQAAAECSLGATSPAPRALFLGFGDSALDLELRVYIEDYQEHATLLDALHTRVDGLFRESGIEIAFPQRDLHLRTSSPVVEFMHRRDVDE